MREIRDDVRLYSLDVEWSNNDDCIQPLEIGIHHIGKNGVEIFSYIRPSDENKLGHTIFHFLRVKKKTLKDSPDFERVLRDITRKISVLPDIKNVAVVWHPDSREYFIKWCREYCIRNPFHSIVSLKEIILRVQDRSGMKNDFEHLLMEYDVKYSPNNLNNSRYDSRYLSSLFLEIRKKFDREEPWNWLVSNEKTEITHIEDCPRIRIMDNRYRKFKIEDLYRGYRFCKICGGKISSWVKAPSNEEKRMVEIKDQAKRIPVSDQFLDESIAAMCISFGFEYVIHAGFIEIHSSCGRWRIYHDGKEVTNIFHGNHIGRMCVKGFHEQKICDKQLFNVLKYINLHDSCICSKNGSGISGKGLVRKVAQSRKVSHRGTKRNYYLDKDEWEDYYD